MEELWIFCGVCEAECPHQVLKSRTSSKRGFSFQGVVKCLECELTGSIDIKEEPPVPLRLRISDDGETGKNILHADKGVLISVGETRPHPDGLILITGLEVGNKRPPQAYSQDNPIVWAKKATHAKIRFAIHEGESTISVKQEFESQEENIVEKKNFETNEMGNDTCPPNPKTRSGFSFLKIRAAPIIEYKIINIAKMTCT